MTKKLIENFLKNKKVFILYRFGKAIGDHVCMSAIIEAIAKQYGFKSIVFSNYGEIFYNNPNVLKVIDIKKYPKITKKWINSILKRLECKYIKNFRFYHPIFSSYEEFLKKTNQKLSLIEIHSFHFEIQLNLKNATPKIYFSKKEEETLNKKFPLDNFAIIQPIGKTTYTPNKEWGFEKYQKVINATKDQITWIQVGLKNEKLLENVIDFRGKTKNIRELAFIIKKANFILSNEGLLNHLAAAVNTKSFVIFSGFHPVEIANYENTFPITTDLKLECAPCWLLKPCPYSKKYCTESISVEKVVNTILKEIK